MTDHKKKTGGFSFLCSAWAAVPFFSSMPCTPFVLSPAACLPSLLPTLFFLPPLYFLFVLKPLSGHLMTSDDV